ITTFLESGFAGNAILATRPIPGWFPPEGATVWAMQPALPPPPPLPADSTLPFEALPPLRRWAAWLNGQGSESFEEVRGLLGQEPLLTFHQVRLRNIRAFADSGTITLSRAASVNEGEARGAPLTLILGD